MRVAPSELSAIDKCAVALNCEGSDLWVECDGENDGTGTSLCTCWHDRQRNNLGKAFPGEGPDACFAAAAECIGRQTARPQR